MKVNVQKILSDVLGSGREGPAIGREDGKFVLFVVVRAFDRRATTEVLVRHEDWTKFVWLCGEYARTGARRP